MNISTAFLVLGFLAIGAGVLLLSIPAGLVVIGVMLGVAGTLLIERGEGK